MAQTKRTFRRSNVSSRIFLPEEVLSHVTLNPPTDREFEGYRVRMSSVRYQLFLRSRVCVTCGRVGAVFLLQRYHRDPSIPEDRAHFILFAQEPDGSLVLMTKDHIKPQSKGGETVLSNLQVMCSPCNNEKGDSEILEGNTLHGLAGSPFKA